MYISTQRLNSYCWIPRHEVVYNDPQLICRQQNMPLLVKNTESAINLYQHYTRWLVDVYVRLCLKLRLEVHASVVLSNGNIPDMPI